MHWHVVTFILSEVYSSESWLHSEDIWHILQFFVQSDSRGGFFIFLDAESWILETEIRIEFWEHEWENSRPLRVLKLVTPIHEHIVLARVSVKITEKS